MKKLMVIAMALCMVAGVFGTAMAASFVVNLASYERFAASPVTQNGTTIYVITGGDPTGVSTGVTLYQINVTTGASSAVVGPFNATATRGASAWATPVVYQEGSGVTVVSNIFASQSPNPSNLVGTSLWAVNFNSSGTATTSWTLNLNYNWYGTPAVNWPAGTSGGTSWTTPLALDGATVYGTSGVSAPTGASIWAVSLGAQTGSVRLSNNQWSSATVGVSTFWAGVAVSGNSLFAVGSNPSIQAGASVFVFDKNKLNAGPNSSKTVFQGGGAATPFATPAVSGNSLFVIDSTGGLTAYSISPTNLLDASTTDFIQLANAATTSVTASPVTNGSFLVVTANHPTGAGVTVFKISNATISGRNSVSWWYEWAAGTTVTATPVISNGNVYVIANHNGDGAEIARFVLSRSTTGRITAPENIYTTDASGAALGFAEFSSPMVVGGNVIYVSSATKKLYSVEVAGANASNTWNQFKADAAKTGNNTAQAVAPAPGDDGGCFLSTIK